MPSPSPLVATGPRSGANPVEKHPDLWFIDGSVVLQADQTVFLVHQTQLARHSLIFRDMFSLPQPSAPRSHDDRVARGSPMYEGHPLVVMHDAAEDVANLLTALYDGPFVFISAPVLPNSHTFARTGHSGTMTRLTFASFRGFCGCRPNIWSRVYVLAHWRISALRGQLPSRDGMLAKKLYEPLNMRTLIRL